MAGEYFRIDMRTFTTSLRNRLQNAVIESVSKPGVKTEIYTALYDLTKYKIPVDTGALRDSPDQNGGSDFKGYSKYRRHKNDAHYAHGEINDKGIVFDPYIITPKGEEIHYASNVDKFRPAVYINDNKQAAYEAIKEILVKEINNE